MISKETNDLLTRVSAGTPMGDYLRRYWHPVAGESEFGKQRIKPIRLLGEDLVLFRDLNGKFGLVDRRCAHRGADLCFGFVESNGLRCSYHGWMYDQNGHCVERPFEETIDPEKKPLKRPKIGIRAYPVQQKAGLLFAYLGSQPAPLVPDWEPFSRTDGFVQIVTSDVPCNWFQCQENSIDPVHFEWTHSNWSTRLAGKTGPYAPRHVRLAFDEFEFGFTYRRIRTDTDEHDPLWTVGRVLLWPNAFFLGNHFEWRVPVDDENTLSICWLYARVPDERQPYKQHEIPTWRSPIADSQTGEWISTHVINQDMMTWAGQGRIADRTRELLGRSDQGIVLMRRRFLSELEAVGGGAEPKGLVREAGRNNRLVLPMAKRLSSVDPRVERRFTLLAGQPEDVRRAYEEAMGCSLEQGGVV
jgi:5,5'-dehydrodivanillate O-demethylase oxygenase subunit